MCRTSSTPLSSIPVRICWLSQTAAEAAAGAFFGFWSIVMFLMSLFFLATFLVLFSLLFIVFFSRRVLFLGSTCVFQFLSSFLFVFQVRFSLFLRRFVRTLKPVKAAAKICTFYLAYMNEELLKSIFKEVQIIKYGK